MTSHLLSPHERTARAWALSPAAAIAGLVAANPTPALASSSGAIAPGSDISLTVIALLVVIAAAVIAVARLLLRRGRGAPSVPVTDDVSTGPEGHRDEQRPTATPSGLTAYDPGPAVSIHLDGGSHGDGNGIGHVSPDLAEIKREVVSRFPELEDYPLRHCREFVAGLGDAVIDRALIMFTMIRDRGGLTSAQLADALGVPVKAVSGRLTGRIARRAAEMACDLPYDVARRAGDGTMWIDRRGVAGRMVTALADERGRRDYVQANFGRTGPS